MPTFNFSDEPAESPDDDLETFYTPPTIPLELDSADESTGVSLRELIEDAAGEAIRENNAALERSMDARFDSLRPLFALYTGKFLGEIDEHMKQSFGPLQEEMDKAARQVEGMAQDIREKFLSKAEAEEMKTELRKEIANERVRRKNEIKSLREAFEDLKKRVTAYEGFQSEWQAQVDEMAEQRATDVKGIKRLEEDLKRAQEFIAGLRTACGSDDRATGAKTLDYGGGFSFGSATVNPLTGRRRIY